MVHNFTAGESRHLPWENHGAVFPHVLGGNRKIPNEEIGGRGDTAYLNNVGGLTIGRRGGENYMIKIPCGKGLETKKIGLKQRKRSDIWRELRSHGRELRTFKKRAQALGEPQTPIQGESHLQRLERGGKKKPKIQNDWIQGLGKKKEKGEPCETC